MTGSNDSLNVVGLEDGGAGATVTSQVFIYVHYTLCNSYTTSLIS